jgi:hypothetical protein
MVIYYQIGTLVVIIGGLYLLIKMSFKIDRKKDE